MSNRTDRFDETEERRIIHGANGYGVELHGGDSEERIDVLKQLLDDPVIVIDGNDIPDSDTFTEQVLLEAGVDEEKIEKLYNPSSIDIRRAFSQTEPSLIIANFDAMDEDTQTNVAQMMKGIAEGLDSDTSQFGYTSEKGGIVTRAEPDLSVRVLNYNLDS